MIALPEGAGVAGLFSPSASPHIRAMRQAIFGFATAFALAVPALADNAEDESKGEIGQGFSLLEEGARLMLRGLMAEVAPLLNDLEGAISDLSAYHPPEILPNGDIILRRKVPLVPEAAPAPGEEIEI